MSWFDISANLLMALVLVPCAVYMYGTEQWGFAGLFTFWIVFLVVRAVKRIKTDREIARLRAAVEEERKNHPMGTLGDPCKKCGAPVFSPGPDLIGTRQRYVRCFCPGTYVA